MDVQFTVGAIGAGLALGWIAHVHKWRQHARAWLAARLTARRMRIVVPAKVPADSRDTLSEWRKYWREVQRS